MLGNGFNKNGGLDIWTDISDYSTKEQLDALMELPMPNGKKVILQDSINSIDLTEEFIQFSESIEGNIKEDEFSDNTIKILNKTLRKIKGNEFINIDKDFGDSLNQSKNLFISLINKHNSYKKHYYSRNAVKNSVATKIQQIISTPSNQILATMPVDVQVWHDAVDIANSNKAQTKKAITLSPYTIFSFQKQQKDAAVGKEDVGISANGLKSFFALSTYYNDYFKNNFDESVNDVRKSLKTFKKSFTFIDAKGETQNFNIATVSDVQINEQQEELYKEALGDFTALKTDAALALSAFTSAATD